MTQVREACNLASPILLQVWRDTNLIASGGSGPAPDWLLESVKRTRLAYESIRDLRDRNDMTEVKIKVLHRFAQIPKLATPGSACFDIYAIASELVSSQTINNVRTGLAFEIPVGYELLVRPRSGLAMNQVNVANSPGTLDSDYRGELRILIHNMSRHMDYTIHRGDRIAQIAIRKTERVQFLEVDELSETSRGEKGMGSTGV